MEYIQKKTADRAVNHFLLKAAEQEVTIAWDRFEGQLPECGFCESGLSCRDCLQGPCISHPFKEQGQMGICGKNRDIMAVQSLFRMVLKGTMSYLDQLNTFSEAVDRANLPGMNGRHLEETRKALADLQLSGGGKVLDFFTSSIIETWKKHGVLPRGVSSDVFTASQKLEGGIRGVEEILLEAFKTSLMGCMAEKLCRELKEAVFGQPGATQMEVNLGLLNHDGPIILIYGPVSPVLKMKIAKAAEEKDVRVMGVCTDPLLPPYIFPLVTSCASQEIPLMTGAVDLIVTAGQFVNPSLADVAGDWNVTVVPGDDFSVNADPDEFAKYVVETAMKSHDLRRHIERDVPKIRETATMGFSGAQLDAKKIVAALDGGRIKGVAILAGSNNAKYTQDESLVTITKKLLANGVLCISDGEASVCLAKYGLLDATRRDKDCSPQVDALLSSLGENMPSVIDHSLTDFLSALSLFGAKDFSAYSVCAFFPEASRTAEVTKAMWTVAMGVPVYFWPCLPVTGSTKVQQALVNFCQTKFGAGLHVISQKMDARAKADLFLQTIEKKASMSGKSWADSPSEI